LTQSTKIVELEDVGHSPLGSFTSSIRSDGIISTGELTGFESPTWVALKRPS